MRSEEDLKRERQFCVDMMTTADAYMKAGDVDKWRNRVQRLDEALRAYVRLDKPMTHAEHGAEHAHDHVKAERAKTKRAVGGVVDVKETYLIGEGADDVIDRLRGRVDELNADNADLRARLKATSDSENEARNEAADLRRWLDQSRADARAAKEAHATAKDALRREIVRLNKEARARGTSRSYAQVVTELAEVTMERDAARQALETAQRPIVVEKMPGWMPRAEHDAQIDMLMDELRETRQAAERYDEFWSDAKTQLGIARQHGKLLAEWFNKNIVIQTQPDEKGLGHKTAVRANTKWSSDLTDAVRDLTS